MIGSRKTEEKVSNGSLQFAENNPGYHCERSVAIPLIGNRLLHFIRNDESKSQTATIHDQRTTINYQLPIANYQVQYFPLNRYYLSA